MNKGKTKVINALLLAGLVIMLLAGTNSAVYAQEAGFVLSELQPSLSADGQTLYNAVLPLVIVVDPNPDMQGIKVPGPTAADALAELEAAASTFSITYVAAGGTDLAGETCVAFPDGAKTAFNAAAAIWAYTVKSSVPIKISACWADLGPSSGILGYSGGQGSYRNFTGAPETDVWYQSPLANSIAGRDLGPSDFDINITFNRSFEWYLGTDGNPSADQFDLITAAAHLIGNGLNSSETVSYSGEEGMTVYAVAPGASNHDPGPVTSGLLKDPGWKFAGDTSTVPTPKSPIGSITDKTPTYVWTRVTGATKYRFQIVKGSTTVYTKTVLASACGSKTCTSTPATALTASSYKWKVQAKVGDVWSPYSGFKAFTVTEPPTGPKAGFWQNSGGNKMEFYVTTDQAKVNNFAIYVSVTTGNCPGIHKITTGNTALPITNKTFSFAVAFYASGIFDTSTTAHGTTGLTNFPLCTGTVLNGGPWNWSATWKDNSQPSIVVDGSAASVIAVPAPKDPNAYIVNPD